MTSSIKRIDSRHPLHRQHRYRWRHSGTPCSCSHRLPHHPHIKEEDKKYLQALEHLNPAHEYGVAFERGTRLTLPTHTLHPEGSQQFKQQYFISGTASIDKHGDVVYEGDIVRQTGRLLENIGALLKDGDATMNDINTSSSICATSPTIIRLTD